ncbi:hypothetical protein BBK36DRAFT_1168761 [Trichoderma citrinoviride]|uniref:NACHT domain-containing protein n=1 Tax=Trichoderma citrinoviride TaxID=58853 RepID=A0A2T4B9X5_9HYPO|nr:hypothetical protein BBK36DRAFT_1168761 [Trichoderma citrinoviride]PTB66135.1 hypothetical protein BBK36DRAFT_1168761 [Trichoderma citrinoviride]
MASKKSYGDYSVGWICALPKEQTAATAMLDERHADLPKLTNDANTYTLGSIGPHNVVIACLPKGQYGTNSAANVAAFMIRTFPSIKIGLMVGIGGGVPPKVRLGDVVVSTPTGQYPGVVQWDLGKETQGGGFERTGALSNPPGALLTALAKLETENELMGSKIPNFLEELKARFPRLAKKYLKSDKHQDLLFETDYVHVKEPFSNMNTEGPAGGVVDVSVEEEFENGSDEDGDPCQFCDKSKLIKKRRRSIRVHHGLIASGNKVIKDGLRREKLNSALGGEVLCFETEAAGLMNNFPCLVIRGICDYCDSHKNNAWQEHAAAVAAAFAKELLEQVQSWISTSKQTLFCEGVPGAGKTFQMAILVNYLTEKFRYDGSVGVVYIYYNFKRHNDQKAEHMLASLVKQLAQNSRSFPEAVQKLYDRHSLVNTRPFLVELSNTLEVLVQSYSKVFILIDALDEAEDTERTKLLDNIFMMQERSGLNLFATSRAINTIAAKFEGSLSREISPSRHDIFQVLNARMSELPSFVREDEGLQDEIKSAIEAAMGGMFLLAQLYLNSFVGSRSLSSLRKSLSSLQQASSSSSSSSSSDRSSVLDEAYDKSMERIQQLKGDLARDAVLIISWIVKAKRQMKVAELQEALAVEIGASELDKDNIPTVDHIIQACASLVVVEGDGIELVHYTAQEYFERPDNRWMQKAQTCITNVCLTYLSFTNFRNGPRMSWDDRAKRIEDFPFYAYSEENWACHTNETLEQDFEVSKVIEFLDQGSGLPDDPFADTFANPFAKPFTEPSNQESFFSKPPPLHIAAFFGLHEASHENGFTALNLAVMLERKATFDLLIEKGANIEARYHECGQTSLALGAKHGRINAVRWLVEREADIDAKDSINRTPLMLAALNKHESIVQYLLEKGADNEAKDINDLTPLLWQSLEAVRILLDKGANSEKVDANMKDDQGLPPLRYAMDRQDEDGLVDVNAKDDQGHTPLHYAIERAEESLVKILLDCEEVDANEKDDQGRTPLLYAIHSADEPTVHILLGSGKVDANMEDNQGRTPLSSAIELRSRNITGKVDVNSKDNQGRTPLWYAVKAGNQELEGLLRRRGARDRSEKTSERPSSQRSREKKSTYRRTEV